jgi:hypothetical protein
VLLALLLLALAGCNAGYEEGDFFDPAGPRVTGATQTSTTTQPTAPYTVVRPGTPTVWGGGTVTTTTTASGR